MHSNKVISSKTCMALAGVAVLWLGLAPGLAQGAGKDTSKMATKFRDQGEAARKAIEKARDQLKTTVAAYDTMLGSDDKKLTGSHKKFTAEIGKMEKAVEDGRKQVTSFQGTAEEFFVAWEEQLGEISTESIKAASEKRLVAARAVFKNMSDNLAAAGETYHPLIASLKEQSQLVAQDMSTDTVAILNKEAAPDVHAKAEQVYESIEKSLSKEESSEAEMDTILDEEEAETGEDAEVEDDVEPEDEGDSDSD